MSLGNEHRIVLIVFGWNNMTVKHPAL